MTGTRLEHVAASMYRAIKWGGWCAEGWEHERPGLREHYMVLAAVAVKALRALDMHEHGTPTDFLDAILNEKPAE